MRTVNGLISARPLATRPAVIPIARPRAAAKKAGIAYEKAVAQAAGLAARHGQWFEYHDRNGRGFCQTDVLVPWNDAIVVLECKYTWTPVAQEQLRRLYLPVVTKALGARAIGIVVCKKLLPIAQGRVFNDLGSAVEFAVAGGIPVLHWIGVGELGLRPVPRAIQRTFAQSSLDTGQSPSLA